MVEEKKVRVWVDGHLIGRNGREWQPLSIVETEAETYKENGYDVEWVLGDLVVRRRTTEERGVTFCEG